MMSGAYGARSRIKSGMDKWALQRLVNRSRNDRRQAAARCPHRIRQTASQSDSEAGRKVSAESRCNDALR